MANNVNDWYTDVLYMLRSAPIEASRNGRVKTIPEPSLWTVCRPTERVLFCPERQANPYLHVMETVWMFAGSKDVKFLLPFSQQMGEYAERDGTINGAYGHRWRKHFGTDQIINVVRLLKKDPETRQAVISMYDPARDPHPDWKDRPCNTTIYFRVDREGKLGMTVCNRSNDAVWGMCGANAVHMTYLHELVASAIGRRQGRYHVMTNNLHIYEHHWPKLDMPTCHDHYQEADVNHYPLLQGEVEYFELLNECEDFVRDGPEAHYKSRWINDVVVPMYDHYMCRLNGDKLTYDTTENMATDWRLAEDHWREAHA